MRKPVLLAASDLEENRSRCIGDACYLMTVIPAMVNYNLKKNAVPNSINKLNGNAA